MPNYVWTVKSRYGDKLIREVAAETVEDAKARLVAEGCTDLVLETGEIDDAIHSGRKLPKLFGETIKPTPSQRIKIHNQEPRTYWTVLRDGVTRTWGVLLLIPLLALEEWFRGNRLSVWLLAAALAVWLVMVMLNGLPSILFRQLVTALEWSRWRRALAVVTRLELLGRVHHLKVEPFYLALCRAKSLAGLGRLPAAVELFGPYENTPGCPGWLHKMFMAGIYDLAKDHARAAAFARASVAEKPTAVGYIDLADRLARHLKDPAQARAALGRAENVSLSVNEQIFFLRCRGIIAWREGRDGPARRDLEAALALMNKNPRTFYRFGNICVAKGYLGCVLARQGDLPAAQKYFAEARKYLEATDEQELLQACRQALGLPGRG